MATFSFVFFFFLHMVREYFVMDESDAPYTEAEFHRTTEDDLTLLEIVKRDGLELDPNSRLYTVGKQLSLI